MYRLSPYLAKHQTEPVDVRYTQNLITYLRFTAAFNTQEACKAVRYTESSFCDGSLYRGGTITFGLYGACSSDESVEYSVGLCIFCSSSTPVKVYVTDFYQVNVRLECLTDDIFLRQHRAV